MMNKLFSYSLQNKKLLTSSIEFKLTNPLIDTVYCEDKRKVDLPSLTPWKPIERPSLSSYSYLQTPELLKKKYLSTRDLQINIGQLSNFIPNKQLNTYQDILDYIHENNQNNSNYSKHIYVIDSSEDDFGSRANFGRGHIHEEFNKGCLTSYEIFFKRLCNTAVNSLNSQFGNDIRILGTIHSPDLTERCWNKSPNDVNERNILKEAVKTHHDRLSSVISTVYQSHQQKSKSSNTTTYPRVYLVNGDHNHMLSAIQGVTDGLSTYTNDYTNNNQDNNIITPIVIYIDLHADSRPIEDGPHSGTWCSEAHANGWIEQAYCIGLNPLGNSQLTIDNLDASGTIYQKYTWTEIKSKNITMKKIGKEIVQDIQQKFGENHPIILSICGDTVLQLPSSAGTNTIGYSSDEIYEVISILIKRLNVTCFTIAELKTSLNPNLQSNVGEFLTQCLFLYHQHNTNKSEKERKRNKSKSNYNLKEKYQVN